MSVVRKIRTGLDQFQQGTCNPIQPGKRLMGCLKAGLILLMSATASIHDASAADTIMPRTWYVLDYAALDRGDNPSPAFNLTQLLIGTNVYADWVRVAANTVHQYIREPLNFTQPPVLTLNGTQELLNNMPIRYVTRMINVATICNGVVQEYGILLETRSTFKYRCIQVSDPQRRSVAEIATSVNAGASIRLNSNHLQPPYSSTGKNKQVRFAPGTGESTQTWRSYGTHPTGMTQFKNDATNMCLDIDNRNIYKGEPVLQAPCHDVSATATSDTQLWKGYTNTNGGWVLQNVVSKLCLTADTSSSHWASQNDCENSVSKSEGKNIVISALVDPKGNLAASSVIFSGYIDPNSISPGIGIESASLYGNIPGNNANALLEIEGVVA